MSILQKKALVVVLLALMLINIAFFSAAARAEPSVAPDQVREVEFTYHTDLTIDPKAHRI